MLIYSICYYYGINNTLNIIKHLNSFSQIPDEKIFVLNVMIDNTDIDKHQKIKNELSKFIKSNNYNNFEILTSFNWGGTILGLWMTYKFYYKKFENSKYKYNNIYIAYFEEDFGPKYIKNIRWYINSKNLLNSNKYIYIGETTSGDSKSTLGIIKKENDDSRIQSFKNSVRLGNPEVWTDGGYYFSNLENLKKCEDKIGIFHKGNQEIKYNHILDGIDIGEVGFPTLLYHHGFKFMSLKRRCYFKHSW